MDRKESLKTILLGAISLPFVQGAKPDGVSAENSRFIISEPMRSRWSEWPDMPWVGPAYWGNRLQDWHIVGGKVECAVSAANRSLHCLTHQLGKNLGDFITSVEVEVLNKTGSGSDYVGLRLGAKAKDDPCPVTFTDYRRAAIYGEGLDVGITGDGRLFISDKKGTQPVELVSAIRLEIKGLATTDQTYQLVLSAIDVSSGAQLASLTVKDVNPGELVGNIALVSDFPPEAAESDIASVRFSDWRLTGSKVNYHPDQTYGPILFAQYTQNGSVLKLTTQLTPVETISGHKVSLQIRKEGSWKTLKETTIHELARTAQFRLEDWSHTVNIPYRICLGLPLKEKNKEYYYEGTIMANPVSAEQIKAAVFSCNKEHGFPDNEVVQNVAKHRPDMAIFLGDQFYESFGGFGVERSHNLEKATMDYLRKWYMFGWSYREIFRHIPSVFIPDDHDVFHGNLWGQGGGAADVSEGFGSSSQDSGGYKMPAEWVKMVERTQTSHLPDPYDPTPVKQGIGVYYTNWNYGGISFAILEDRKFKTAPGSVLPTEVINGFVQDPDFDFTNHYNIDADLLGERQEKFLEEWTADWSNGAQMKVLLSQSPFCGAHTLPEGVISDRIVPRRPIPERGEYPRGDMPAKDMDTNGWPQKERDKALRIIRKGFALHLAGDQHLASVIQYGVDKFGDSGFVYTLPALNNTWPRRWWPAVGKDPHPLPGQPKYTGDFKDGFDNRITVLSVANPVRTNRIPAIIYDRATGYGIVNFDKANHTIHLECWPRYVDPQTNPEGQYDGWPITIDQQDNYGRRAIGYLPEINITGLKDPVIKVINQSTEELVYALRIKEESFRPKVFEEGLYKVRVGDPDKDEWQEYKNLSSDRGNKTIKCKFL